MQAIMYQSSVIIFCVCWNLVNGTQPMSLNFVSQLTAQSSRRHDGNVVSKIFDQSPPSTSKSNVLMTTGRNSYGGLVGKNKLENDFKNKMKLKAKKSSAEFYEPNESMDFENTEVSREIINFFNDVFAILKEHLINCLKAKYDNDTTLEDLWQFIEFISIHQYYMNNSIFLLSISGLDITRLMKLYLFFCGPFQEPSFSKNDLEFSNYGKRIGNIQNDMIEKFKDIIGDESTLITNNISNSLTVSELKKLKRDTDIKLLINANNALKHITLNKQSLPSTPTHFICIGLLKWTTLMTSDNEDAVEIQNTTIIVENNYITMRQYAEKLKYEIDINNLAVLHYEVLLRINNTFLRYLYKHFIISAILIDTNKHTLKAYDPNIMSLVLEQMYGIRVFLDVFNLYFVYRYLGYLNQPTSQTKLMTLISYTDRFKMDSSIYLVNELRTDPEKTINDILKLLKEIIKAFLQDLNIIDRQKWFDRVNGEIIESSPDFNSALEGNKNKALAIMYLCIKQLNPYWPEPNKIL